MTITIRIKATQDGFCPESDIFALVDSMIPPCYLSEYIGKNDQWALVIDECEVEVKTND